MHKFHMPSPAMAVASVALFAAVGTGSGLAATGNLPLPNNSVHSAQIANNGVRSPDLHRHSVSWAKLAAGVQQKINQHATSTTTTVTNTPVPGPKGDKGDTGARGATGPAGQPGDSYLEGAYYAQAYYNAGDTNGGAIATVACQNQSDTAISGGVSTDDYTKTVPVGESFPGRMDWSTNTPMPNRLDGWVVQFASQNGTSPEKVKIWALCVPDLNVPVVNTYTENGS